MRMSIKQYKNHGFYDRSVCIDRLLPALLITHQFTSMLEICCLFM